VIRERGDRGRKVRDELIVGVVRCRRVEAVAWRRVRGSDMVWGRIDGAAGRWWFGTSKVGHYGSAFAPYWHAPEASINECFTTLCFDTSVSVNIEIYVSLESCDIYIGYQFTLMALRAVLERLLSYLIVLLRVSMMSRYFEMTVTKIFQPSEVLDSQEHAGLDILYQLQRFSRAPIAALLTTVFLLPFEVPSQFSLGCPTSPWTQFQTLLYLHSIQQFMIGRHQYRRASVIFDSY